MERGLSPVSPRPILTSIKKFGIYRGALTIKPEPVAVPRWQAERAVKRVAEVCCYKLSVACAQPNGLSTYNSEDNMFVKEANDGRELRWQLRSAFFNVELNMTQSAGCLPIERFTKVVGSDGSPNICPDPF